MLTIITGTPGAGKSLYTVWEEARKVPGSTLEAEGEPVPRRLLSNIKNLLLEHTHIDAADLDTWHTWAKPGDVIVFDEVQEVWRPRGLGIKVPDCIAKLETHRHMGVDLILITQHPMLVDPNIRRLCNRHLHLRRISRGCAYIYEWDHCANPGATKTAMQGRLWFHPKKAYSLYKSAQLHTKPTARMPRIALVGMLALAGLGVLAPTAYSRITERFTASAPPSKPTTPAAAATPHKPAQSVGLPAPAPAGSAPLPLATVPPRLQGCMKSANRCLCVGEDGYVAKVAPAICEEGVTRVATVVPLVTGSSPPPPERQTGGPQGTNSPAPQGGGQGDGAAGPMSTGERSVPNAKGTL